MLKFIKLKFNKKYFFIFSVVIFLLSLSLITVYAVGVWNTGYRINTETKNVLVGSGQACHKVTNTSGNSYFIPTKTTAEWNAFASHLPSGVSVTNCCTSHASFACYNNDVYWYDSCGVREGKASECGIDSYDAFGAWYCSTATVRQRNRTFHDRGCSAGACFDNTSIGSETTNCGGNYCGSWGSWYCQDDNTRRRDRTCHNRGCSGSSCYDNTYTDFETITCGGGTICSSGSCQYPTVCQYNFGIDYYFMAKCYGNAQTMIRWNNVQVYQSMQWELGPITVGSYKYSRGSIQQAGGECSPPYYYTVCRQQQ